MIKDVIVSHSKGTNWPASNRAGKRRRCPSTILKAWNTRSTSPPASVYEAAMLRIRGRHIRPAIRLTIRVEQPETEHSVSDGKVPDLARWRR
jgi:hypothetical protein